MIQLDPSHYEEIAKIVGDTPFTVAPYFLLKRRSCDVYADNKHGPRYGAIVAHGPRPDAYAFGAAALEDGEVVELAEFLAGLESVSGYTLPASLVQAIRARRAIAFDVEGLCFSYRRLPPGYEVWRPEFVRQLTIEDSNQVEALPQDAAFLLQNYGSAATLLEEGLAFGVFRRKRLVSLSVSLALTDAHCDVGVYTRRRHRSRGYGTDCVEAIFDHVLARGIRPLWRIGFDQKIAIYFAEKLEMDEIGTNGQEVYLQVARTSKRTP